MSLNVNDRDKVLEMRIRQQSFARDIQESIAVYREEIEAKLAEENYRENIAWRKQMLDNLDIVEHREAILREALERIANSEVGAIFGGTDGELLRLSREIAREALLRAGRGEGVTRESHTNRDDSPKPEGRSCKHLWAWYSDGNNRERACAKCGIGWTPAAPSGEG